jgi:hypothetical protein
MIVHPGSLAEVVRLVGFLSLFLTIRWTLVIPDCLSASRVKVLIGLVNLIVMWLRVIL